MGEDEIPVEVDRTLQRLLGLRVVARLFEDQGMIEVGGGVEVVLAEEGPAGRRGAFEVAQVGRPPDGGELRRLAPGAGAGSGVSAAPGAAVGRFGPSTGASERPAGGPAQPIGFRRLAWRFWYSVAPSALTVRNGRKVSTFGSA